MHEKNKSGRKKGAPDMLDDKKEESGYKYYIL